MIFIYKQKPVATKSTHDEICKYLSAYLCKIVLSITIWLPGVDVFSDVPTFLEIMGFYKYQPINT